MMPFLLVLVISVSVIIRNGKSDAVKTAEDKLLLMTSQTNQLLSNIKYNIKSFSTSSALQNALSAEYPDTSYGDYMLSTSIHAAIYNIMDIQSIISSGYIQTSNGIVYDIKTDSLQNPTSEMNMYYEQVISQKGLILLTQTTNSVDKSCINISKALIDINTGEYLGILSFNIKEDLFYDIYQAVVDDRTEQVFLLNSDGRILSSSDRSLLLSNASPQLIRAVRSISENNNGLSISQDDKLILSSVTSIGNYYVVYVMNYYNIYQEAVAIALPLMITGVLVLLITIILATLVSRSLTKPLTILTDYADRIGQGDFTTEIHIHSTDEIGILAERFRNMNHNLKDMTIRIYNEQTQKKEYELNLLQAQINPHFLYNCLENINSLITDFQNDTAASMVYHLGRYYRSILSKGRNIITIEEELQLIRDYLEIQLIKTPDLFTYTITVDSDILELKMLKLLLQPIVENSVLHGFLGYRDHCHIRIEGKLSASTVNIRISDNGRGISSEVLESLTSDSLITIPRHFGLKNIKERIQLKYGPDYGITIISEPQQGTVVSVTFPKSF